MSRDHRHDRSSHIITMRIALLAVTEKGKHTAQRISQHFEEAEIVGVQQGVRQSLHEVWACYDGIVCIMAAGIVVRCLGGLCRSKYRDPCVVVLDENGDYAISLLSGHLGGGNELARRLAKELGGEAVITTGSDVSGHTSIDLWTIENNLSIADPEKLAPVSATLLNRGSIRIYQDQQYVVQMPDDFSVVSNPGEADIVISLARPGGAGLWLVPRTRIVGCGCRKGTSCAELQAALQDLETATGIDMRSVAGIASIDLKEKEPGLIELARLRGWPTLFYSKDELGDIAAPSRSEKVFDRVGVYNVCEAAAIKAAGAIGPGRLIVRKMKWKNITMAVAEAVT